MLLTWVACDAAALDDGRGDRDETRAGRLPYLEWAPAEQIFDVTGFLDTGELGRSSIQVGLAGTMARGRWQLRLGVADDATSQSSRFASLALGHPLGDLALGLGVTHAWLADAVMEFEQGERTQAEVYAGLQLRHDIRLTPAIQWIGNSGFDIGTEAIDGNSWVGSVRLSWDF